MYYSYRGKDGVLPGIRLATSRDGRQWTRQFNDEDPRGMGQIFASTPNAYYEWHQILKVDNTYVLCIEVGVEHGKRWRPGLAVSTDPVRGWTQLDLDTMLQTQWRGSMTTARSTTSPRPRCTRSGESGTCSSRPAGAPQTTTT